MASKKRFVLVIAAVEFGRYASKSTAQNAAFGARAQPGQASIADISEGELYRLARYDFGSKAADRHGNVWELVA